jgi:hypothetical protein
MIKKRIKDLKGSSVVEYIDHMTISPNRGALNHAALVSLCFPGFN